MLHLKDFFPIEFDSLCRFKLVFFHAPNLIFHLHETLVMFLYNFFGLLHLALVCNFLIHLSTANNYINSGA